MKDSIVKRVIAIFVLMLAILVVVALVAVRNIRRSIATSDWVNHTHAVILEADAILASLHAGDAALRSFLITADTRDQAAYREAYTEMNEHLGVIKALTRNEPINAAKIATLEPLIAKRIDFTREMVKSRPAEGLEGARKSLLADAGSGSLNAIKKAITTFQEDQKILLRDRDKASYLQAQTTRWTVLTGVGLNFLLLGFTAWLVRDDIAARTLAARALEDANAQLETKVQERTAELAAANETLRAENLERQWGHKSLEHQLRYSNLIINSINDLVFVLTKTLNITRINPAVSHLTGFDAPELITTALGRVVRMTPDAPAPKPDPFAQALQDGREIQDCAVFIVKKDGSTVPCRLNLVPLRDRDKVVGGVVTLRPDAPAA